MSTVKGHSTSSEREWLQEFNEFMGSDENRAPVPTEVSKKILNQIKRALNPSAWVVFLKFLSIHAVVGTLSLSICDQFGLNPFATGFSLSNYFMKMGHSFCMFLCGVLFIGLSVFFAALLLSGDEFRVFRKNSVLQVFVLSLFSLSVFVFLGAEVTGTIGLFWLIGAMGGGLISAHTLRNSNPSEQLAFRG